MTEAAVAIPRGGRSGNGTQSRGPQEWDEQPDEFEAELQMFEFALQDWRRDWTSDFPDDSGDEADKWFDLFQPDEYEPYSDYNKARSWREAGLSLDEVSDYRSVRLDLKAAISWRTAGFKSKEAVAWFVSGESHPEFAAQKRDLGYTPGRHR